METMLVGLKAYIASALLAQILQNVRQNLGIAFTWRLASTIKALIGDVEGSGIAMSGIRRGVGVYALQPPHIVFRTQQRGDNQPAVGQTLQLKPFPESLPYRSQQGRGTFREIRDGMR